MTHYPFPPLTGSSIVAYNSIKHLSKHHSIDLICFKPNSHSDHTTNFVNRVIFIPPGKVSKAPSWIHYLPFLLMGISPMPFSIFTLKVMKEAVQETIEDSKYDAVLLFDINAIQYCSPSCYNKLIVNIEDPQSIMLNRMMKLPIWSFWQRAKLFIRAKLAASFEKKIIPKIAKVLLLSTADIQDLCKQGGYQNLAQMSYGINQIDSTSILNYEDRERTIIYSGSMYHPPNVDGALFLLRDIFPLILLQYPSAILWIVGADPDNRIYEAAAKLGTQVLIMGKVPNIADYIKRATVSVCPVRLKIGVQTKILEALSWGTPVVTTSAGNSGIGGVSGTHLWVEDDPYLYAQRVVTLLQGHDWQKLSEAGKRLTAESFCWEDSVAQLEQQFVSLTANL